MCANGNTWGFFCGPPLSNFFCFRFRNKKFYIPGTLTNKSDIEIDRNLIIEMSAPKFLGGYLVDHISLHCDLFLLKPVMKYIKFRVQNKV